MSETIRIMSRAPLSGRQNLGATLAVVTLVLALGGVGALIRYSAVRDLAAAHERRREAAHLAAIQRANQINTALDFVYSSVRTISKLPSVRTIDRHAATLTENDRTTIQEIYNNLFSHVHVSEIYITPAEFNPDATDPATGKPEEPAIMFDDNIVGQTGANKNPAALVEAPVVPVPEVEIYEYHEIRKQIAAFHNQFGLFGGTGLNVPAMISREVITCDNSYYQPAHPNDKDRSGIIYSVPYYGTDGSFRGVVSAIMLTRIFIDMLGDGNFALYDQSSDYLVTSPTAQRELAASLPLIKQVKADPALLYSEVIPVRYHDSGAGIFLWSGLPNTAFTQDPEIQSIRRFELYGYCLTGIFGLVVGGVYFLHRRQRLIEVRHVAHEHRMLDHLDKTKTEFLANISRELRTPMRTVLSQIHIGLEQVAKGECAALQKYLGTAQLAAWRMLQLVNDLLDLSELEAGQMVMQLAKGDLAKAIADACAALQPSMVQRQLHAEVADHTANAAITMDQKRMTQVFTHILTNATRYAPVGSTVALNLERAKIGDRQVVRCRISNSGAPIPDNALETIFDKFVRSGTETVASGTGLGLAICRAIVTRHQGRIWAENLQPQGVVFTVELPLEAAA